MPQRKHEWTKRAVRMDTDISERRRFRLKSDMDAGRDVYILECRSRLGAPSLVYCMDGPLKILHVFQAGHPERTRAAIRRAKRYCEKYVSGELPRERQTLRRK